MPPPTFPRRDRAAGGVLVRGAYVLGRHVLAADVVQKAVPGFGDHRQRPRLLAVLLALQCGEGVAYDTDASGVGQPDRRTEQTVLDQPGGAGHLTIAVQPVNSGVHRSLEGITGLRMDDRHAGADRAPSPYQRAVTVTQRRVSDAYARHVGDGVVRPGPAIPDHDLKLMGPPPIRHAAPPAIPFPVDRSIDRVIFFGP